MSDVAPGVPPWGVVDMDVLCLCSHSCVMRVPDREFASGGRRGWGRERAGFCKTLKSSITMVEIAIDMQLMLVCEMLLALPTVMIETSIYPPFSKEELQPLSCSIQRPQTESEKQVLHVEF